MKPTTIITIVATLLIFVGFILWGYEKNGATASAVQGVNANSVKSVLIASQTFYDFGTISMKDGNVNHEFAVTNSSNKDVVVSTVLTSCMCTTAFIIEDNSDIKGPFGMAGMGYVPPANETIKAGESRVIRVVYDPNAHGPAGVGIIDRFITLTDTTGGELQLEIKAIVTP